MLGRTLGASAYLMRTSAELERIDVAAVEALAGLLDEAHERGRLVFLIGNGGSAATASHLAEDLAKCTLADFTAQRRLRVLSLTDNTAGILAWGNDEGFDRIFVEQLKNLAGPGDVLLALSGSGNSPNILRAVEWARQAGLTTVGLTGFDGGRLRGLVDQSLHVAVHDMGMVESLHLVLGHWLVDDLYRRFAARPR